MAFRNLPKRKRNKLDGLVINVGELCSSLRASKSKIKCLKMLMVLMVGTLLGFMVFSNHSFFFFFFFFPVGEPLRFDLFSSIIVLIVCRT